jgi:serralysin
MPTFVPASSNSLINALLWGWKWDSPVLTYSMPNDAAGYSQYEGVYWAPANGGGGLGFIKSMNGTAFESDIHKVMRNFSDVCGLSLTEDASGAITSLRFAQVDLFDATQDFVANPHAPGRTDNDIAKGTAEAFPPDPNDPNIPSHAHGDSWFNTAFSDANPGSFEFAAWLLHEPGHALGLKHGHITQNNSNGLETYPALPASKDSQEFSIMTYRRYIGQDGVGGDDTSDYPTTLMMLDIRALQHLYGPDFTSNSSNTTYLWKPNSGHTWINGADKGGHANGNVIFQTIWDGNGIDTYDLSRYNTPVKIDLRPGQWTKTSNAQLADLDHFANPGDHMARGNIANALQFGGDPRSLIERAYGGDGSDTIYGNVAKNKLVGNSGNDNMRGFEANDEMHGGSGNDSIDGGKGLDTLTGNSGVDYFIFRLITESGTTTGTADYIRDFSHSQRDRIHLSAIDAVNGSGNQSFDFVGTSGFSGAGEVRYRHSGGNTYIYLNTDSDSSAEMFIKLAGIKTLVASDFIL